MDFDIKEKQQPKKVFDWVNLYDHLTNSSNLPSYGWDFAKRFWRHVRLSYPYHKPDRTVAGPKRLIIIHKSFNDHRFMRG